MSKTFGNIAAIDLHNPSSWNDHIFITFDTDWVCDEILAETIDLVEKADVAVTWFATHDTPLLQRLRENPKFELGIHPNFNSLLNGDARNGVSSEDIIDNLLAIVPNAKSVRSHSLTQNSKLLDMFVNKGLTHDCNNFIPCHAGMELKPYRLWNGLIKVPYYWEDDAACIYAHNTTIQELANWPGLKVFNFHPIHVFLNTENLERYERTRELHFNSEELINHRYSGYGTRSSLKTLLGLL